MWTMIVIAVILLFGFVVFWGAPYVPTRKKFLQRAFSEVYPLSDKDLLVDIGSGDGVVLRQAARCGAKAVGYELNPILVVISKLASFRSPKVETRLADFWRVQLPADTTIVYTFGETRDIKKMYAKIESESTLMGKQLYFMSFAFPVPDQKPIKKDKSFYLYRIDPK
jgi:hypothetical protein